MALQRVKFVYDDDATFEECNGEQRPLTEDEYAKNSYMGCPRHPRGMKEKDTTAKGEPGRGVCACGRLYEPIPYSEYLAYYGNPGMHVYIGYVVEERCKHCKSWHHIDSLYNIDIMRDDPALNVVAFDTWIPLADALKLPGYFGRLIKEIQP